MKFLKILEIFTGLDTLGCPRMYGGACLNGCNELDGK